MRVYESAGWRSPAVLFVVALVALGCDVPPVPGLPPGDGGTGPLGPPSRYCEKPYEGCACDPGVQPLDCYLPPVVSGARTTCRRGTRYCRDGSWSACDDVRRYRLPHLPKIVTSPVACNPCDPACASSTASLDANDLTPASASGLVYRASPGPGISLRTGEGSAVLQDTDGDGIDDTSDECVGPGFRAPCDGSAVDDGYYHRLPFGGSAVISPMNLELRVTSADVYVLMDGSNSMEGEIANLRSSLSSGTLDGACTEGNGGGVLGAIRCTIPDAWFGVGLTREVPENGDGSEDELPFHHLVDVTDDFGRAQRGVNALATNGNADWPEAQTQALYAIASGRGFGRYVPNRAECPDGGFGYPCFREGTVPIVVLFTDAPFHEGPSGHPYAFVDPGTAIPPMDPSTTGSMTLVNEAQSSPFELGDLTNATSRTIMGSTVSMAAGGFTNPTSCAGGNASGPDAVFRFTLTSDKTLAFDTRGSDFDTVLSVWRDGGGSVMQVACNDDRGAANAAPDHAGRPMYTTTSRIARSFGAGTYYVALEGYGGANGAYRLLVDTGSTPAGSTTDPFPVAFGDTRAALQSAGVRVITMMSCACQDQAIAAGQCNEERPAALAACASAQTACSGACVSGQTSCLTSCSTASSSCTTQCTVARTACDTTANSIHASCTARCTTLQNYCNGSTPVPGSGANATRTSCGADRAQTCNRTCTEENAWCRASRPSECTGTCATAWNTQCDTASVTGTCSVPTPSACASSGTCAAAWNTMCGRLRGTVSACESRCSATAMQGAACGTECGNAYSASSFCVDSCVRTRTNALTTCATSQATCTAGCTTNKATCDDACVATSGACGATCTSSHQTCVAAAPVCAALASAFASCRSGLGTNDRMSADGCYDLYRDAVALANATGSVNGSTGAPFVYPVNPDGSGLSASVVTAVRDLASYTRFGISVVCEDNLATAFDECQLVESIATSSCPTARCNGGSSGASCNGCLPGTMVGFNVSFRNDAVAPADVPRVFEFSVAAYGNGDTLLDRVPVRIVVPPVTQDAYDASGWFQHTYDANEYCTIPSQRPRWGNFEYTATTPPGTALRFELRTANSEGELGGATAASVTLTAAAAIANPIDLDALLRANGLSTSLPFLRVSAIFVASPDRMSTPTLGGWGFHYTCVDAE